MTYISILAWMILNQKSVVGETEFDGLLDKLCNALYRRMLAAKHWNLPSFPNGIVFLPDMMFSLISLHLYHELTGTHPEYELLLKRWVENARKNLVDPKTGLLISLYYSDGHRGRMMGSHSALNCSGLAMFAPEFAREQYELFKRHFARYGKYAGVNEYLDSKPELSFHIDAGPIVYGMSPTGVAFSMGAATCFGDWHYRQAMLNTCELAGNTIRQKDMRHYRLADIMLTGEAITLGMRTYTA